VSSLEEVWCREAPHVLGALVRRYGDFDACEDALQEAMVDATTQWARDGVPDQPRGWLVRVASRRLVDRMRSERARDAREVRVADREEVPPPPQRDDALHLLYLCCHPALTPASQVALTLRAVGGLSTDQIAAAFLVPVPTMAQRISRAKSTLRSAGARFEAPPAEERAGRLAAVRHVLYLAFNEGYTASGGDRLVDVSLTREAIRLCRELTRRLPDDDETGGCWP
jgi:RNA polymerase sigma factor (sigma-70 family)